MHLRQVQRFYGTLGKHFDLHGLLEHHASGAADPLTDQRLGNWWVQKRTKGSLGKLLFLCISTAAIVAHQQCFSSRAANKKQSF
jgi:hypothetical protein